MYQFMVGATTTPRVTRMAMTSGTNKWASRAVVILQLAAWSAVGIVLLQKGVTSLQKAPSELNNVTQLIPLNLPSTSLPDESLSVLPLENSPLSTSRQSKILKLPSENWRSLDPEDEPRVLESVEATFNKDPMKNPEKTPSPEQDLANKLYFLKKLKKRTKLEELEELAKKLEAEELASNATRIKENREKSPEQTEKSLETAKKLNETTANATSPTKTEGIWESRRRARLSHLSGGGAAAAVAMVAVGAVMLVLGPAVIVLRALDERRQERRFLKLSGRDDLPPTYEQATLMDEAPRYSTLSLNTILGPPPPPSPTPVRAHLV